ncbi:hypothetical protein L3X38_038328 [Prunus dulcis]|uniref:Uncharacterized protein n=1 Tax=Prunus dulcis TaxID=3755 RepID=A0AAD4V507_PRUDU|nr:hypothetical protein L3X38_038328 [Prunus dulcis]
MPDIDTKAFNIITAHEDVSEVSQAQLWKLVSGHVVGSLSIQATCSKISVRTCAQLPTKRVHLLHLHQLTLFTGAPLIACLSMMLAGHVVGLVLLF